MWPSRSRPRISSRTRLRPALAQLGVRRRGRRVGVSARPVRPDSVRGRWSTFDFFAEGEPVVSSRVVCRGSARFDDSRRDLELHRVGSEGVGGTSSFVVGGEPSAPPGEFALREDRDRLAAGRRRCRSRRSAPYRPSR